MKKTTLLAATLLCFGSIKAQKDTTIFTDEVIVSATRIQVPLSRAAHSISIINAEEISRLPVQSVNGILAFAGGVDIRQRGPVGSQADIGIRGGGFDQTLLLIDGAKIIDPQTGHHLLNLPLNPEYIERIEIIRGGGAKIYGANAYGGVINIVTKKINGKSATLKVFGGDFALAGASADVASGNEKTSQLLSISYSSSNGYRKGNDFENTSFLYKTSHVLDSHFTVEYMANGSRRNMGAAGYYVLNSTEYEKTGTLFSFARLRYTNKKLTLNTTLSWRYNDDEYIYIRLEPKVFRNKHHTHVLNAEVQGTYQSIAGITGFGADARQDEIYSNNLGERKRNFYNFYLEHRFVIGGFVINPGFNVNYVSTYNWQVFPGIDLSKSFLTHFTAYANLNKSYRVPTYTDLYYKGPSNIGNPDLQPEQAWNGETGIKYNHHNWYAQTGVFIRQTDNLIDWVRKDSTLPYQPLNYHQVTFRGVEAEVSRKNLGPVHQLSLNYTGMVAEFTVPAGYLSRYSLGFIKHQVQARVTMVVFKNLLITPAYRYVERLNMAAYHLLDARVEYRFRKTSVFIDASNITATTYTEAGFVPMPGLWLSGGIKCTLL